MPSSPVHVRLHVRERCISEVIEIGEDVYASALAVDQLNLIQNIGRQLIQAMDALGGAWLPSDRLPYPTRQLFIKQFCPLRVNEWARGLKMIDSTRAELSGDRSLQSSIDQFAHCLNCLVLGPEGTDS